MLQARKAAAQTVSILGKSCAPMDQISLIKSSSLDRDTKDVLRQCLIAAMNYQSTSKENLEKSKTMLRKNKESCEISSRAAAFAVASALKLNKWKDADELLTMTNQSPPAIESSLKIFCLAKQSKLDEALNELEKFLIFEENVFATENYCVSDEALDQLCDAIKACPDSTDKMKRFRTLQRLVTKYSRRTAKPIDDLLYSPIRIQHTNLLGSSEKGHHHQTFIKSEKFQEFVKNVPYLADSK